MMPHTDDATPPQPLLSALTPQRVAVFRALQLGDMLCAVPSLRALRRAVPHARITLVGLPWAQTLATRLSRYVDDFIAFPGYAGLPEQPADARALTTFFERTRRERFDLAIQLHGDGRITNRVVGRFGAAVTTGFCALAGDASAQYMRYPEHGAEVRRLLRLMDFLGAPRAGEALEFPLLPADHAELAAFAPAAGLAPGEYICLHPGARAVARRWPADRFAAVGDALHHATGLPLVLTGSAQETQLAAAVRAAMRAPARNAAGPISVGALGALLSGARLLVCNDTGVAHLAAAFGLPSVVIFRASEMARWAPLDRGLHRPVWDPDGRRVDAVLGAARALLDGVPAPCTDNGAQPPPAGIH